MSIGNDLKVRLDQERLREALGERWRVANAQQPATYRGEPDKALSIGGVSHLYQAELMGDAEQEDIESRVCRRTRRLARGRDRPDRQRLRFGVPIGMAFFNPLGDGSRLGPGTVGQLRQQQQAEEIR